tara:strand:+ start:1603 stop:2079 length:477 start_codon:yes stop_codon:yes gene_type:complete
MKNPTPIQIANKVKEDAGIDIYQNRRDAEYVEYRALLCFILRDKLQMRWTYIASFFESQGKHMDHSNAMHLFKMYPIYKKSNKKLARIEKKFYFTPNVPFDEINKIDYLEKKYIRLETEHLELKNSLKNPLVKLVLDVPTHKTQEMRDRIKMIKNAWS